MGVLASARCVKRALSSASSILVSQTQLNKSMIERRDEEEHPVEVPGCNRNPWHAFLQSLGGE
jgi:hypothetical protein